MDFRQPNFSEKMSKEEEEEEEGRIAFPGKFERGGRILRQRVTRDVCSAFRGGGQKWSGTTTGGVERISIRRSTVKNGKTIHRDAAGGWRMS